MIPLKLVLIINCLAGFTSGVVVAGGGKLLPLMFNCGWLLGRLGLTLKNARRDFAKLVGEL